MDARRSMDPWRVTHLRSRSSASCSRTPTSTSAPSNRAPVSWCPDPVIPAADEYQRKLSFEITEALAKRKSPKDALDNAAKEWDRSTERRGLEKQKAAWGESSRDEAARHRASSGVGGQGQVSEPAVIMIVPHPG